MKYKAFLGAVLFLAMILFPLFGPKKAPAPADVPEPAVPPPEFPPAVSSSVPEEKSASSSAPPKILQKTEEDLPVSAAAAVKEPVLLLDESSGQVLTLSQEQYVLGAVCSEMPPDFHPEALKAQAVAAHSYILRCRDQEKISPNPDLKGAYLAIDTESRSGYASEAACREMYGSNFDIWFPEVKAAVQEVVNQILVYDEEPIVAAYHSISAGTTEDASNVWTGSADYLVPVQSPGDRLAPDYETTITVTVEEARNKLLSLLPDAQLPEDPAQWFADCERSASGYVTTATVGGQKVSGQSLRRLFGMRSSHFTAAVQDGQITFTVTGYGHGIGMSQYGADYMARQGSDYREILEHYYPGAQLSRLQ